MLFGIRIVLMCITGHVEYVLFYWSLHDMLNMYCLHAYFCRVLPTCAWSEMT